GIGVLRRIDHAGAGYQQVEDRGNDVDAGDHENGGFGRRVQVGHQPQAQNPAGDRGGDQRTAHHDAQQHRDDGEAFYPAVPLDQQMGGQHFGDDAVFGGRVGGGADA